MTAEENAAASPRGPRPGRNDPCPCGSGKKYKRCCLEKDAELRRSEAEASFSMPPPLLPEPRPPRLAPSKHPLSSSPLPPADPHVQAFDARWKEFEAADCESRIALFLRTLGEPDLMDGEMAFEMLSALQHQMVVQNERHRFEELAEALRQQLPDVYDAEAPYVLSWRIDNALATGQPDRLAALARELALISDRAIDTFFAMMNQLAYHGQLETLLDIVPIAWSRLKESSDILPWGLDDLAERAMDFVIFGYLERSASPDPDDPHLLEQIQPYVDIPPDRLSHYLSHLTGQTESHWSMVDFAFRPPPKSRRQRDDEEDPGRRNLIDLSAEFLGYLRREENVPYTRGELAREQIARYIQDRFDGELVPRPSMMEAMLRPKKRQPKPPKPDHLLCPDRATLDIHLGRLCNLFALQTYKAAALFDLIPAWLRFLEARGLIDASRREATLSDISPLRAELLQLWGTADRDPALRQAMERWNEPAGLGTDSP